ncbi:MAG TPA: hypothetical protein VI728_09555, partial [Syntrophales bacterium]|nr:hypothetical protein [Syntrophales bacterium]
VFPGYLKSPPPPAPHLLMSYQKQLLCPRFPPRRNILVPNQFPPLRNIKRGDGKDEVISA